MARRPLSSVVPWGFLLKFVISASLIWLLLRGRDFSEIYRQAQVSDQLALAAAWVILVAVALPNALRWSWVLRAMSVHAPLRLTVAAVLIGNFFNQLLPSTVGGGAFRAWKISTSMDV